MSAAWLAETDLEALIGVAETSALLRGLGGRSLYLPKTPRADHEVARHAGLPALAVLCDMFGGGRVCLPTARYGSAKHSIRAMLREGKSVSQIAMRLRVSERYVSAVSGRLKAGDAEGVKATVRGVPGQLRLL